MSVGVPHGAPGNCRIAITYEGDAPDPDAVRRLTAQVVFHWLEKGLADRHKPFPLRRAGRLTTRLWAAWFLLSVQALEEALKTAH